MLSGSSTTAPPATAGPHRHALLVALAVVTLWGINFPLQKAIYTLIGPIAFLGVRYLIVPVACVALLYWRYGWRWPRLVRRDWLWLLGLAFIGQGVHVAMAAIGLASSTAFSASVLLAVGPVFTLVIASASGVEKASRWQTVGIGIAVCGVLAFTSEKLLAANWQAGAGDLVLLVAALLFSIYTVGGKSLTERHGAVVLLAYGGLACTLPMVALSLPALMSVPWRDLPWWMVPALLWSVVGGGFLGWLGWAWAGAQRGVARTAPLIYLSPVIAGLSAWFFLGEAQSGAKLMAAGVVLAGVALAQFGGRVGKGAP